MKTIHNVKIFGPVLDEQTRCTHYHSPTDIIAILFPCCQRFYPCYKCHEEETNHAPVKWKESQFNTEAILCGQCGAKLTIHEYMKNGACLTCKASFNPGCKHHYPIYFEQPTESAEEKRRTL
ncbi:CHY zinc finger protein [Radiobacillus kanasensis]|uniref:CHY zinc finger protein n=1 Tax=Radiobacillus kanasensis TaxID=2844358 RepID=UPI001E613F69|nr:CHY zinc finger protein [Radiobacillus kanasensis]UFU01172.1 CHY zinc finger protein [Radiobacillus kanasensis]